MSTPIFDALIKPLVEHARNVYRETGRLAKIEITLHADLFVLAMSEAIRYRTRKNIYDPVEIHNRVVVHCSQEGRVL